MIKNSMRMLLILPTIFSLSFCGHTREEKITIKKYEEQGEKNAIDYIEDKYGFTPKIIKVEAITETPFIIPDLYTPPTGNVLLSMSHNNKKFTVEIQGDRRTIAGMDDYQYNDIVKDILETIKKDTNIEPYNYSIKYGDCYFNNLINEYYTKENLVEIMDTKILNIILEYIDKSELRDKKYSNTKNIFMDVSKLAIINYHSKKLYSKRSEDIKDVEKVDDYIQKNALNIEYAFAIFNKESVEYNMDLYEYDGIYFYDFSNNKTITVKKDKIDTANNWVGHGTSNPKIISDAYSIRTNAYGVSVYIPVSKTKYLNEKVLKIGEQCETDSGTKYMTNTIKYSKVGDYYADYISLRSCNGEIKFVILQDK